MTNSSRIILSSLVVAVISLAMSLANNAAAQDKGALTSGSVRTSKSEPAPDIQLRGLNGNSFKLSDLRGQVVILNFWATWCAPCRVEIPDLNAVYHKFEKRGLAVLGVSWDDTPAKIKSFQKEIKQDYKIALDGEVMEKKFGGVPGIPTTYIIDRNGVIRTMIVGPLDRDEFESIVSPLLEENSAAK